MRPGREPCVGDQTLALEVTEDQVSYALKMLRLAGLAGFRKDDGEATGQPASRCGSDRPGAAASASDLSSRSDDCSRPCRNSRAARAGPSGSSE